MKARMVITTCLLVVCQNLFAEDGIKSSVELGMVLTSGNTETQSLNAKGAIEHTAGKLRNSASVEALNVKGKVDGKKSRLSEKYVGAGKTAYQYSKHSYSFLAGIGEHDPFSGYAYQVSLSLGYGYRAYNTEKTVLDLEIGPGYRQTRLRGVDEEESDVVARLALKGEWKISKTAKFTEELVTEGADYWITKSTTSLSAQVNGNLSTKLSLIVKNNTDAPEGTKETDTETAVTLVYSF